MDSTPAQKPAGKTGDMAHSEVHYFNRYGRRWPIRCDLDEKIESDIQE